MTIIIGDVHGNLKTLKALIKQFPEGERIVLTGDLVDRGPRSRETIEFVRKNNYDCVKGNHEQLMGEWSSVEFDEIWLNNGGRETLYSYGWPRNFDKEKFKEHQKWQRQLPIYLEYTDAKDVNGNTLLVTHSSASKVWKWSKKRRKEHRKMFENHILWERSWCPNKAPGVFNVFGHTPVERGPRLSVDFANIDGGCTYHWDKGYAVLIALQFPEMIIYKQKNIDHEDKDEG